MTKKLLRFITAVIGAVLGCGLVVIIDNLIITVFDGMSLHIVLLEWALVLIYVSMGLLFAILFYVFSPKILESFARLLRVTEDTLTQMPISDMFFAVLGLVLGLLVALLLSTLLSAIPLPWLVTPMSIVLYILCGYLGVSISIKRRGDLGTPAWLRGSGHSLAPSNSARPKILDTSVIIDGRIFDICETGIVEGVLIIPTFVLNELRHIADSADALKRSRGRRGLDILGRMQKELRMTVRIEERDYEDIAEVDAKLLKLAQDMKAAVVTNDYNLNKVAAVHDVLVLNINELAKAMRPVVLPGEEMNIAIIKEGKEQGQGVAYMDDGTMIVVENGKRAIGEQIDAVVTSVLQTAAGRMIFAKKK